MRNVTRRFPGNAASQPAIRTRPFYAHFRIGVRKIGSEHGGSEVDPTVSENDMQLKGRLNSKAPRSPINSVAYAKDLA